MGKEKTEFEEKFVSKTEKTKKLWEKRITENTTLSMESVQWMAQRINSLLEYMQYGYALIAYRKQDGSFYMGKGTLVSYESDFKKPQPTHYTSTTLKQRGLTPLVNHV